MARVEKESGVKVRWVPWEGRPEGIPFLDRTPEEAEKLLAKHKALSARYGMDLIFPWKKCRTRLAHQATLFAWDHGRMEEFRDAVYDARYQQDLDISDPGVLVSIGERVGLDAAALRKTLDAETYAGELDELRRQGEEQGVTGIPTYVVDGKTYWGSDSTDEVLEAIANRSRPST